jgi:fructose-1,6-bisphosphatase/inositol monophosphatase family enzyme
MFGTLVSLLIDGEPVFGCIHLPALRETTYAARGFGCWLTRDGARPQRVRVGRDARTVGAQVGLTSVKESDLARRRGAWRLTDLVRAAGRLRLVGDCVQYALLCRGAIDAAVDPLMKPWDIGALAPCVLEAGGSISDLNGETRADRGTQLVRRGEHLDPAPRDLQAGRAPPGMIRRDMAYARQSVRINAISLGYKTAKSHPIE